jgi:putative ABC transport system permease protein
LNWPYFAAFDLLQVDGEDVRADPLISRKRPPRAIMPPVESRVSYLYGVITYTVSQRRQELGLRAALRASGADLLRLVVADGLWMTAAGAVLGLLLAAALSQLVTTQLFRVQPIDTTVYAGVTTLFIIVAGLACGIPAFQAARVDPAAVLRNE